MNYISVELANEIQNRCDIVDIISRYVSLKKTGSNNYFGLCPFHNDKNHASMSVNQTRQIFNCFTCHKAGNVFTFLSLYLNITYYEAVGMLGNELGYDIKVSGKKTTKYDEEYKIYDLATKFYQNNLYSNLGRGAISYLDKRNINSDTIKKFKIGLSLTKSNLTPFLENKNYTIDKLTSIGLTNENGKDIFINRIMFPLFDVSGNVVAFSGRIYNTVDDSKYINTKQTDIFIKGNMLYNYHNVKKEKQDCVIVMEGFMDVIRADTVGITNCVATMGTAFTKEHLNLLKRISNNIILCFDGDSAGENATSLALNVIDDEEVTIKVIRLPDNLDPDEYITKYGKDRFDILIQNSISSIDFKMNLLKRNKNLVNVNDISKYIDEVIKELINTNDNILVELKLKELSKEYNLEYDTLKYKYVNYLQNKKVEIKQPTVIQNNNNNNIKLKQYEKAEYYLIYYMLNSSNIVHEVSNRVIYFPDDLIRYLFNEIESYLNKYGIIKISSFMNYIIDKQDLMDMLNKIISYVKKEEYTKEEIDDYINVVNNYLKKEKVNNLKKQLAEEIDPIKKVEILNKIMEVKGVKV